MNKSIFILVAALFVSAVSVFSQGGGFQPPSPEERVKRAHLKIDSAFKLDSAKMNEIDELMLDFYKKQDKAREEVMAGGGGGNFQEIRAQVAEKMKPHQEALDAKLKTIMGDENFNTWKEKIEPALRGRGGPQRNN